MFKEHMREELYNYARNQLETIKKQTVNIINENVQLFKEISEPSKEELKKYRKKDIETSSTTAPLIYVISDEELQTKLISLQQECEFVEREIERRDMEALKVAYEFFHSEMKPLTPKDIDFVGEDDYRSVAPSK
jgi:hypothetical protein